MLYKVLKGGWCFGKDMFGYVNVQVNYYVIKSCEDFLFKCLCGMVNLKNKGWIDIEYFGKYDLNVNFDDSICIDGICVIFDEWLQDVDLVVLYCVCIYCLWLVLDY